MNCVTDRRLRIYYLPVDEIVRLFQAVDEGGLFLSLPQLGDVPEDARVVHAFHDMRRDAVGVVVAHPSFELVATNNELPSLPGFLAARRIVRVVPVEAADGHA